MNPPLQYRMLGAPEVISMNALLIKSLGGKKVIDVGVYTGASSLGAALALPDGRLQPNLFFNNQMSPQMALCKPAT